MLNAFALLLLCQLAGELGVRLSNLPVPGPVAGMLLLFLGLVLRRKVPDPVAPVAGTLLRHLSLLFVPAGVGIVTHLERIRSEWLALGAALLGSTLLTLIVTALVFRLMARLGERSAGR